MSDCQHNSFESFTKIKRLTDVEGGPVTGYVADITIRCTECGLPFSFVGPECGLSFKGPTVDVDGTELRIPISPGPRTEIPQRIRFEVPAPAKDRS